MAAPRLVLGLVLAALVVAVMVTACDEPAGEAPVPDTRMQDFERENRQWRNAREARLVEPYGWLSLIDFVPVESGSYSVGQSEDNDIVVPDGPDHWGELRVEADEAEFIIRPGADVTIGGEIRTTGPLLTDPVPTQVQGGRVRIQLVRPGDRMAVRVRDPQAPTRTGFEGLEYFDLDPDWRVDAEWQPHEDERTIPVANVLGQLIDEPNPGRAVFEYGGERFALEALLSDGRLFFIFADRTSGRETYGLGRFLYADLPGEADRVTLDFNQAYNPPCAFTAFSTCPLPPPENRLTVEVRAGEKAYAGPPGLGPGDIEEDPGG